MATNFFQVDRRQSDWVRLVQRELAMRRPVRLKLSNLESRALRRAIPLSLRSEKGKPLNMAEIRMLSKWLAIWMAITLRVKPRRFGRYQTRFARPGRGGAAFIEWIPETANRNP